MSNKLLKDVEETIEVLLISIRENNFPNGIKELSVAVESLSNAHKKLKEALY